MSENTKSKKKFGKLRNKYRFVLINEDSFEERFSLRLSRLNVFSLFAALSLFWVFIMIYLMAFTSLREYIPGYTDPELKPKIYQLNLTLDSLETQLYYNEQYIENIRRLLRGEDLIEGDSSNIENVHDYGNITNDKSKEDSLLRFELEKQSEYNIYYHESEKVYTESFNDGPKVYFSPLTGIITNKFNANNNHFGIDIVAKRNDAIKAIDNGIVVLAEWTINTGYVIVLQHTGNVISVYKHNSALLKHAGEFVKAGELISIIGNTGEQSSGQHLHFELWINGSSVDPLAYISL